MNNKHKVSIRNYWRMYKARGLKLPFYYFFQAHLFDLLHKTDTHTWLPKDSYPEDIVNLEHGVMYMCSWTSEIKRAFRSVSSLLGNDFEKYNFIDVGCGKGKVVAVWHKQCEKYQTTQNIIGIDYHPALIETARDNHLRLFNVPGKFYKLDATQLEFRDFGERLIIYLYNPFDAKVMTQMLKRLKDLTVIVIYNNPTHSKVFKDQGWNALVQHNGFHPNLHTIIYTNQSL